MKSPVLILILAVIIAFTVANYFFIAHFSNPKAAITPSSTLPPTSTAETSFCQKGQLAADIMSQGAAGNIYATLTLTNTGKSSCEIVLGNTISANFNADNIVTNYKQNLLKQDIMLAPSAKVYSQVHYPNGPQCQSPIMEKPITFIYKTDQTVIPFQPTTPGGQTLVQACSSPSEKTVIDIWPLSKRPITQ